MIYSLKGLVSHLEPNVVIIECNNIGFKCNISDNSALNLKVGEIAYLYTYLNVKEDSLSLFAFFSQKELNCFKLLINISGVGPKAAISILSSFTPDQLSLAVSNNDFQSITKCPGVGKKTAQRLILELKDKISNNDTPISQPSQNNRLVVSEAIEALKSLGYSEAEILKTIKNYDTSLKVEDIIKKALKEL